MFGTHKSLYSPDGFSVTYLSAQITVGHARVEYAPWTDSPSASIWLVPPEAPPPVWEQCGLHALIAADPYQN